MANRTLRVLLKKIYTDGSIDTIYLKSRASDVFLDGSSTDTLASIVTKVNGIQEGATAVSSNATNGYISINGTATQVYAHPNSGVTAGTYNSVTVNAAGHVTAGTSNSYLLSSSKVTFTTASTKANIVSNSDTIAVMLGKLAKWYTSFGSLAWLSSVGTSQLDTTLSTAYNQRVVTGTDNTTASVTESREITAAGYVADARAVANLQNQINTINSSLSTKVDTGENVTGGLLEISNSTGNKQIVWFTNSTKTSGFILSLAENGGLTLHKVENGTYTTCYNLNLSELNQYSLSTDTSSDYPMIDFAISPAGSYVTTMYSNYLSSSDNYGRRLVFTNSGEVRFEAINHAELSTIWSFNVNNIKPPTQNIVALQTMTTEHSETSGALQWSSTELVYMHPNLIGWNGSLYGAGQLHVKKAGAYLAYIRVTLVTYTTSNANLILGLHMSTDSGANFGAALYNLYLSNYNPTYTATVMLDTGYNNPYGVNGQMPSPVRLRLEVEQIANVSKYHVFMKFYYMGDVYG